ncbi:MAG: type II secretion system F family protein [Patescibacteria group bacterium]|jgi:type II secretory pathway component PulF
MDNIIHYINKYIKHVSVKEKAFFSRQLATMLSSGLPLTQSLYILAVQSTNEYFKSILNDVIFDLEAGYNFHNALSKHPKVFNKVFVSLVKAGESSGKLEQILDDLATQIENDAAFSSKIKAALLYPVFILVVLIGVSVMMMVKVIPQLEDVFKESNAKLPWITTTLMSMSRFMVHYWWICIFAIVGLVILVRVLLKTDGFEYFWNKFKIKGPIIGKIVTGIYMHRFTNTLSLLTSSGIPIIESLDIVGDVMNNRIYIEELQNVAVQVERGVPISVPLSKNSNFPLIVSQMIMVGEQTGKLDKVLKGLAKYYYEETDNKIKGISSLFEPVMIVFIGGGVAFLVFAILMPIYNLAQIQ